jgi:hypothetical protein
VLLEFNFMRNALSEALFGDYVARKDREHELAREKYMYEINQRKAEAEAARRLGIAKGEISAGTESAIARARAEQELKAQFPGQAAAAISAALRKLGNDPNLYSTELGSSAAINRALAEDARVRSLRSQGAASLAEESGRAAEGASVTKSLAEDMAGAGKIANLPGQINLDNATTANNSLAAQIAAAKLGGATSPAALANVADAAGLSAADEAIRAKFNNSALTAGSTLFASDPVGTARVGGSMLVPAETRLGPGMSSGGGYIRNNAEHTEDTIIPNANPLLPGTKVSKLVPGNTEFGGDKNQITALDKMALNEDNKRKALERAVATTKDSKEHSEMIKKLLGQQTQADPFIPDALVPQINKRQLTPEEDALMRKYLQLR